MCSLMSGFRFNGNGWKRLESELGRGAENDGWQRVGSGIMLHLLVRVSNVLIFPLTLNLCPGYGGVEFSFKKGLVRRECECWFDRWGGGGHLSP